MATIADRDPAIREGGRTSHLVVADGMAKLRRGPRRLVHHQLLDLSLRAERLHRTVERRDLARTTTDRFLHPAKPGTRPNPMAPPVWLLAASLILSVDFVLGRYLIGLAVPDDGDRLITIAAAGVAAWVFTTSHVLGSALRDWLRSPSGHDRADGESVDAEPRRHLLVAGGFVLAYSAFAVSVLVAAEAGLGRWAISFVPLVAGSLVQANRPDLSTARWLVGVVHYVLLTPVEAVRRRALRRASVRFFSSLVDIRLLWAETMAVERSVEAQWGLGDGRSSPSALAEDLDRLAALGLVPERRLVDEVVDQIRPTVARKPPRDDWSIRLDRRLDTHTFAPAGGL